MFIYLAWLIQCAVRRREPSVGDNPTRQRSLQPEAIGVKVEATKSSKPLMKRVAWRLGEYAGRNENER
ncbi:MAG: hypothetical protein R6V02_05470, partial [Candidatus Aminicenantes bacterium]